MAPLLEISGLAVAYGGIRALDGIDIHLDEGEIVTVLGANGAGKSTLLQAVAGLVRSSAGTICLDGESLGRVPAHEIVRKGVSLSPEGRRVFPTHTVEENLNLGAYTRQDRAAEVLKSKERVYSLFPNLKERWSSQGTKLSGGEQQMLAIGRALMSRPKVLLLDEPSLGLAPIVIKQIFEIITAINAQGTTILLVEQNAHKALNVAARGYVLENGRIAAAGPAAELKSDPKIREAYLGGAALRNKPAQ